VASEPLHETRFPGESGEYRAARDALLRAELELRRAEEAVAAQRRELPIGGEVPTDYVFDSTTGPVALSDLFGDKDTLVLYSFMFLPEGDDPLGRPCPSCTSIIDAVDGAAQHLESAIALAASAKVPLQRFTEHATRRGWSDLRLLSSVGSTYNTDYHAEAPDGSQWPLATVFVRRDGRIHHSWSSELFFAPSDPGQHPRHVDLMWPIWKILDLTPGGRGDFDPQLAYDT
jgi:predicted dithiol-disulfide oxidoreductase (DUF899 family)